MKPEVFDAKPVRQEVKWDIENGTAVLIFKKNFTRFERALQRFLKGPENVRLRLDNKGTDIWLMCDGNNSIKGICEKMNEKYREDIEPVVPRVTKFLVMLLQRNLIKLKAEKKE